MRPGRARVRTRAGCRCRRWGSRRRRRRLGRWSLSRSRRSRRNSRLGRSVGGGRAGQHSRLRVLGDRGRSSTTILSRRARCRRRGRTGRRNKAVAATFTARSGGRRAWQRRRRSKRLCFGIIDEGGAPDGRARGLHTEGQLHERFVLKELEGALEIFMGEELHKGDLRGCARRLKLPHNVAE